MYGVWWCLVVIRVSPPLATSAPPLRVPWLRRAGRVPRSKARSCSPRGARSVRSDGAVPRRQSRVWRPAPERTHRTWRPHPLAHTTTESGRQPRTTGACDSRPLETRRERGFWHKSSARTRPGHPQRHVYAVCDLCILLSMACVVWTVVVQYILRSTLAWLLDRVVVFATCRSL